MPERANKREKRLAMLVVAAVVVVTVLLIVETFRLLLPGLSGEVAWHPAGRAAFGGAAGLYRWNADELDEERNGKLRMENGKLA